MYVFKCVCDLIILSLIRYIDGVTLCLCSEITVPMERLMIHTSLHSHLLANHRNSLVLISSEYCDFKTANEFDFKVHVLKHTGETVFICNICQYRVGSQPQLSTHMTIHTVLRYPKVPKAHTSDKSYQCNYCDTIFY